MSLEPPELILRRAVATDAPGVASLLIDCRLAFMTYAPSVHPEDVVRAWVAGYLIPSAGVTVAERRGRVIGLVATALEDDASWITQIAVDPAEVGKRVGSVLLVQTIGTPAVPIRLYTFQANLRARRFFERHGFVAIRFTDGQDNEERCPDVLYELKRK